MSVLKLEHVTKSYGTTKALNEVSFECQSGEFFTIFGPSGAGKTTILELIAGVKKDYSGSISIQNRVVDKTPIQTRNVAMAFENYSLYPHMNIRENIEFPLKSPRAPKMTPQQIEERVQKVALQLGIEKLLERNPVQLSGGQKQRASLARCLVRQVEVYLLDEPLAHLDAKLRSSARADLKAMANNLGATIVYVTHDFREALGLSDRVLILKEGVVQQIGKPRDIYFSPTNDFVAYLVGDPTINLLDGSLLKEGERLYFKIDKTAFPLKDTAQELAQSLFNRGKSAIRLGVRPSGVQVSRRQTSEDQIALPVYSIAKNVGNHLVYFDLADTMFGGIGLPEDDFSVGENAWIRLQPDHVHLFDKTFNLSK